MNRMNGVGIAALEFLLIVSFILFFACTADPEAEKEKEEEEPIEYSTDYFSNDFDPSLCSFFDKFDGKALDLNKWGYQNGNGNNGWGNQELQYYHEDNVTVQQGFLRLEARLETRGAQHYTSGKLVTAGGYGPDHPTAPAPAGSPGLKFAQTYGRFEAKIRLSKAGPTASAMWPAFWMMPINSSVSSGGYGGWPRSGEIDIMEMTGQNPTHTSATLHCANTGGGQHYRGSDQDFPEGETTADWHVYGTIWKSDEFIFLIDGKEFRRIKMADLPRGFYPDNPGAPFNRDFHLILNLAVDSGRFNSASKIENAELPIALEVDWVRCYTLENDPWEILGIVPHRPYNN